MALVAQFDAQGAPGQTAARAIQSVSAQQSWMDRAQLRRLREQESERVQFEDQITRPIRQAKTQADLAKMATDYQGTLQTQKLREQAYEMLDRARADFDFLNLIEDDKKRAQASREWLSRYSQLGNIAELKSEMKTKNDLAAKNILDSMKIAMLAGAEERFYNNLTDDFSPDEKKKAARVKTGIAPRPSSAAIAYKRVPGPDGRPQLVAVDPREVGAQVIGSGQTYGSGVNETEESVAVDEGRPLERKNTFIGQTPEEETRDKELGKLAAEKKAALPRRRQALEKVETTTDRLIEDIDKAISQVNVTTAGPGGVIMETFPGTSARDLQANLDSIAANVGFEALQAMRDASKTGGALGNISERELDLLQATLASLKIGQSPTQLIANLKKARNRIAENAGTARRAFQSDYGSGDVGPSTDLSEKSTEELEARLKQIRGQK